MGLKDVLWFKLMGVPPGASTEEVRNFLLELGWRAIPQSKQVAKGSATWFISAENKPPSYSVKWGPSFLYIEDTQPQELRDKRQEANKKKAKAVGKNRQELNGRQWGSNSSNEQSRVSKVDPWMQNDP